MTFLIKLLLMSVSIYLVGRITHLFTVDDFTTAFVVAILLAVVNVLIKPILVLITIPITIITLGIFLIFINGFMLIIVSKIIPEFKINGCFTAAIASVLISFVNSVLEKLLV